jgi:hypothetical protein
MTELLRSGSFPEGDEVSGPIEKTPRTRVSQEVPTPLLEDYGFIGDLQAATLVGRFAILKSGISGPRPFPREASIAGCDGHSGACGFGAAR